ncbi:ExbD/TolR family protein [Luteolibacter marinus]|uniref:ExbD/TolR family protein n=1 Tax=Luteolibacter marinus TaxID=2776705 RepID=UPI001866448A|nr:biopolymer transporter ExbD [Luteolibacter marinus]
MKFQKRQPEPAAMQLAPMIDIVFLLLIFFIVTWQFSRSETEVKISVPSSQEGADPKRVLGEIIVNVRATGEVVVEGMEMSQAQLKEKLAAIAKQHKNQPVRLRGDAKCEYQTIVEVIDTCQRAGIWNISFATQRKKAE